jgi:hypothetical protein
MLGSELKTFVESLIDDTIEETLFLTLLNVAKDWVEEQVEWEMLKTWDRSLTYSPGYTYLTELSLPTGFRSLYGDGIIYLGEDNPYSGVPFGDLYRYRQYGNRYTINYLTNKLHILGSESVSYTINIPYLKTTEELTLTNSWAFPARFHKLLGFRVAGYYTSGVDADDIYARMSPAHRVAAQEIYESMKKWNTRIILISMGNSSVSDINSDSSPDGRLGARIMDN